MARVLAGTVTLKTWQLALLVYVLVCAGGVAGGLIRDWLR